VLFRSTKSKVDPFKGEGAKPTSCTGRIEFRDVCFSYPQRQDVLTLKHVSFVIPAGSFGAFVGASGCGKSTIMRLLLRFYDVTSGEILLDGVDIRTLNVQWLRAQFGLVAQEPDLFNSSLEYNILYGDPREELSADVAAKASEDTEDIAPASATEVPTKVAEAAQAANASKFIDNLRYKFQTRAGEFGSQLSGGQKQRVAIARAIIREPKILLLDEATSALDTESERVVQAALDELLESRMRGVTTLSIAHRLSTIHTANPIIVMHNGRVEEVGDHASLVAARGRYRKLVDAQDTRQQRLVAKGSVVTLAGLATPMYGATPMPS